VGALDSDDVDIVAVLDCLQSDSPTSGQEGEPPGTRLTRIKDQQLVLKPQRMGGGNNVYREASLRFWAVYIQKNGMDRNGKDRDSAKVVGYLVRAAPSSASDESAEKKAVQQTLFQSLWIRTIWGGRCGGVRGRLACKDQGKAMMVALLLVSLSQTAWCLYDTIWNC
jgi:hypothetical protein